MDSDASRLEEQATPEWAVYAARREYSARLGFLTDKQLQTALSRFHLGDLVGAEPIQTGFGQNLFLTSTTGQYVLRGCPHWDAQFPKEQFLADQLHERTRVPVAWPYLLDPASDIFGWSYLLMPRMPGTPEQNNWPLGDRTAVARAAGTNLAQMQELTWPFAGDYDLKAGTVVPFVDGLQRLIEHTLELLEHSRAASPQTTEADAEWVMKTIQEAQDALHLPFEPCFVMNDYKSSNFVVSQTEDQWRVTGLFDLSEGYFGNGEADLVRQTAHYLYSDDVGLANAFVQTYLEEKPLRPGFSERFRFFMLRDRLIMWDFGTTPGRDWFDRHLTFREYAERYVCALSVVLPDLLSVAWESKDIESEQ